MTTWADLEQDHRLLELLYPRAQLRDHLRERIRMALVNSVIAQDKIIDISGLNRHREQMRKVFLDSIGGLPADAQMPTPACSGIIDNDVFKIEKIVYFSRSRTPIAAHLYLPKSLSKPTAAVLVLCGHSAGGKSYAPYQSLCQRLAHAGIISLIQDPIGQGERLGYEDPRSGLFPRLAGVTEHDHAGNQCLPLGDGIARYFLHDALQGIALLRSRPEVNPRLIGVTGFSGGGTQTAMVMLADPEIAAAAPGIYITDREACPPTDLAQDAEQVWPGFLGNGFDHADILLSLAPKPVHVLAATYDYFSIEGTRRSVERARAVCHRLGMDHCIHLTEVKALHSLTSELEQAATDFFSAELLGKISAPIDTLPLPEVDLRCFETGQAKTSISYAENISDENSRRLKELLNKKTSRSITCRREEFSAWLRGIALCNRKPVRPNLRIVANEQSFDGMRTEAGIWWSQEGICNHGRLFLPAEFSHISQVTVALWDGGTTCLRPHLTWLRKTCAAGRAVLVLDPTAVGAIAPLPTNVHAVDSPYGSMRCLSDALFWLGDSLMAMRIYDAMRAIDALDEWPALTTENIHAYACGHLGICLLAAAAIDRRYKRIDSINIERTIDWVTSLHYDESLIRARIIPGSLLRGDWNDLI